MGRSFMSLLGMLHNASQSPLACLNGSAVAASLSKPARPPDGADWFWVNGRSRLRNTDRVSLIFCSGQMVENRQGRTRRADALPLASSEPWRAV